VNPADRRQEPRRSTDAEIADLTRGMEDLADDVREVKRLMETNYVPRLSDLETWRTQWAATELEREKQRALQAQNAISRRSFWIGFAGVVLTILTCATGIVAVVLSNS
jgi:hypothetical protein